MINAIQTPSEGILGQRRRKRSPNRVARSAARPAGHIQWQNQLMTLDVNRDGIRTARDALNVINWIERYGGGDSEEIEAKIGDADSVQLFYFDTTGDGKLSARDALLIINDLIKDVLVADQSGHGAESERIVPTEDAPAIEAARKKVASFGDPATLPHEAIDIVLADREADEELVAL